MVTDSDETVTYHLLDRGNSHRLLGAEVFDHEVDARELARFVAEPAYELVFACSGERVVGFCSGAILRHPDKKPIFLINEVGVMEAWQRRGIGFALCRILIRRARSRGCKGIWLATETDNAAARALYGKLRGRETEAVVIYDWDGAMDE